MNFNDKKNEKLKITQDQQQFVKNSFYSFLNSYGPFIFTLCISFLLARMISKELWGFLILANSYILIVNIILSFLPPGLETSTYYYIPKYMALNENNKLKSYIRNVIILKSIFLIPIFFLIYIIFSIFSNLFMVNLKEYFYLLFYLSPLILINGLDTIFFSINRSFNMFKTLFILLIIRYAINIGALIFLFLFINPIEIELIALIKVISTIIPFILNCFIILIKYFKIKNTDEERDSFKDSLQKALKYGITIKTGQFFSDIWKEIQYQGIGILATQEMVTGYNISKHYSDVSRYGIVSFSAPLTLSFSSLTAKKDYTQINKIYTHILKYMIFLLSLITGILIFCRDFFLIVVYGESYLIFSNLIIIMLISPIFLVLGTGFESLILAENKVKYITIIRLIALLIRLPLFFIGLIFFDLITAIFGLFIGNTILAILYIILSFKIFNYRIDLKKIFFLFLTFFLSFGITIALDILFLSNLNTLICQNLNLSFFESLRILSLGAFLLLFFIFNIIFKIFSLKDIEYIETYFEMYFHKFHRIMRFPFKIVKKIIKD